METGHSIHGFARSFDAACNVENAIFDSGLEPEGGSPAVPHELQAQLGDDCNTELSEPMASRQGHDSVQGAA